jgi:SAM-dependent methyltransferase
MNAFENAQYYVGNVGADYFTVGRLQLELLRMNGLHPSAQVLEIGCGCLVAGLPIIRFLDAGRYVGIEPNQWLIDAAVEHLPNTRELFQQKQPVFLNRSDFDASELGRKFDFIISHSILSHAAHWQCPQFLAGVAKVLAPAGVALVSIRFYDANNNLMGDSLSPEWVYPEVSYFAWESVQRFAAERHLCVEWRTDYRDFFVRGAPSNYHDWIRLTNAEASTGQR